MILRCLTDEALCARAQNGDRDAADELMRRYEWSAVANATAYYFPGGDHDDVEQEARLGLLRAIACFDPTAGASFRTFSGFAIRRQLITALKAARRGKFRVLDEAVRVARNEDGEEEPAAEHIPARDSDPQAVLETKEELARIRRGAATLSGLERRWLGAVLDGRPYTVDNRRNKSADNAIVRARQKLRRAA